MAEIATRKAYGEAIVKMAETEDIIVLDADLAAATQTAMFKKAYPDRFFDCGIAESNMMGVAAGLAACGKTVFCSTRQGTVHINLFAHTIDCCGR